MSFCDAVMSEANPLFWFARAVTRSSYCCNLLLKVAERSDNLLYISEDRSVICLKQSLQML